MSDIYIYETNHIKSGRKNKHCFICGKIIPKGTSHYDFKIYCDEWTSGAVHEECYTNQSDEELIKAWEES